LELIKPFGPAQENYGAVPPTTFIAIAPDGCPEHNKSVLLIKLTSITGGSVIVKVF
jgi:hypothetical protein